MKGHEIILYCGSYLANSYTSTLSSVSGTIGNIQDLTSPNHENFKFFKLKPIQNYEVLNAGNSWTKL